MKIDFEEIKELLKTGNLSEVSRQTGIAYRTLQDWKLENNKWLKEAEARLTKLQNYINEENNKMEMVEYSELINDHGDLYDERHDTIYVLDDYDRVTHRVVYDGKGCSLIQYPYTTGNPGKLKSSEYTYKQLKAQGTYWA